MNMQLHRKIYFVLTLIIAGLVSCEKDPEIPEGLKSLNRLGGWQKITPQTSTDNRFFFEGRSNSAVAVWGNSAYILGSGDINNFSTNGSCWKYDMNTNVLSYSSYLPDVMLGAVAFAINGQLFYGLGRRKDLYYSSVSEDFSFWSTLTTFPGVERMGAVSFVQNNKAYVGLGFDGINYLRDFYEFDPVTFKWKKMADLPGSGRQDACVFMLDGNAYVGTGYNGSYLKDVWKYNVASNTWLKVADLPGVGRDDAVAFTFDKHGYIGTGWGIAGVQKDFWEYNPALNTWVASSGFATGRYGAVAWAAGNTAYMALGNNSVDLNDFWKSTIK
jgi:N-acetylneuraminic acid mutarotase